MSSSTDCQRMQLPPCYCHDHTVTAREHRDAPLNGPHSQYLGFELGGLINREPWAAVLQEVQLDMFL